MYVKIKIYKEYMIVMHVKYANVQKRYIKYANHMFNVNHTSIISFG